MAAWPQSPRRWRIGAFLGWSFSVWLVMDYQSVRTGRRSSGWRPNGVHAVQRHLLVCWSDDEWARRPCCVSQVVQRRNVMKSVIQQWPPATDGFNVVVERRTADWNLFAQKEQRRCLANVCGDWNVGTMPTLLVPFVTSCVTSVCRLTTSLTLFGVQPPLVPCSPCAHRKTQFSCWSSSSSAPDARSLHMPVFF